VRAGGHFGDRVSNILAAMARAPARGSGWCGGGRISFHWLRLGYRRFFRHKIWPVSWRRWPRND
jgi:hypothetical protein